MKNYKFTIDGEAFTARIVEHTEDKVIVDLNGNTYNVELTPEESAAPAVPAAISQPVQASAAPTSTRKVVPAVAGSISAGGVTAPIPGVVVQIPVATGDKVSEGSVVLVLEAMKMENQISAVIDGTISRIAVKVGDSVADGQLLIQIEAS